MTLVARNSVARTITFTAAAVAASVAIPFLVHLLPGGASIGASLLPIFWAPLLAAVFFGPVPAVAAALLAPALNHLITGMPPAFVVTSLTVELAIFVALLMVGVNSAGSKRSPLLAPLAYLIARVGAGALLVAVGASSAPLSAVFTGLTAAIPGLLSLFIINGAALLVTRRTT